MNKLKPVWIDTDAGVDDAYALISAFKLPGIEIVGISTVSGNVECEKTFKNTRNILSLIGREDVKVYAGAKRPLMIEPNYAYEVHGEDGLGGAIIPDSKAVIEEEAACDALYKKAKELNGKLTLVTIGPLTNIAITLYKYPDFGKYIKELAMMGGSVGVGGNSNIAAEFNIFSDPHSAQTVFKSGIPIVMFGLDVTMKSILNRQQLEEIGQIKNPICEFAYKSSFAPTALYASVGMGDVLCLHDTCPLVYLSYPDVFKGKQAAVLVETRGGVTMGKTVSDIFIHSDEKYKKNALVMLDVDIKRFSKIVLDTLEAYND